MSDEKDYISIRRHWSDSGKIGKVLRANLSGLHWDQVSGGLGKVSPRPFLHGYVMCNQVVGDIAHSCQHGPGPHRIKVCIVQKDNTKAAYQRLFD